MADDDLVELDLDRADRRGYPEAVYCEGKSAADCAEIARRVRERPDIVTLFTRADPERADAILCELPDAHHDPVARLLVWPPERPARPASGSSWPAPALLTCRWPGRHS